MNTSLLKTLKDIGAGGSKEAATKVVGLALTAIVVNTYKKIRDNYEFVIIDNPKTKKVNWDDINDTLD